MKQDAYSFRGVMTLTSPMHVADMAAGHYDEQTHRFLDSGDRENAKRTRFMPIVDQNSPHGNTVRVPYFPSNDFRGRLRRKAAWLIFEKLIERGDHLSLGAFHGMTCGSVTGRPAKGSAYSLAEDSAVRNDLWMALFGGGPKIHQSGLRTHDLLPVCEVTINAGMVPPVQPALNGDIRDITYGISSVKKDDVFLMHDPRLGKLLGNYREAVTAWSEAVAMGAMERKKAKGEKKAGSQKDSEDTKESIVRLDTIYVTEAIAPGTPLYVRVDLAPYLDGRHVGLIAASLADLTNENALGGLVSKGFGHFTWASIDLYHGERVLHRNAIRAESGTWTPSVDLKPFITELEAAVDSIKTKDIEGFFSEEAA